MIDNKSNYFELKKKRFFYKSKVRKLVLWEEKRFKTMVIIENFVFREVISDRLRSCKSHDEFGGEFPWQKQKMLNP